MTYSEIKQPDNWEAHLASEREEVEKGTSWKAKESELKNKRERTKKKKRAKKKERRHDSNNERKSLFQENITI